MKPSIVITSCTLTLLLAACVQDRQTLQDSRLDAQVAPPEAVIQAPLLEQKHSRLNTSLEAESVAPSPPAAVNKSKTESRMMMRFASPAVMQGSSAQPWRSQVNRDVFGKIDANGVKRVMEEPVSTFSIDVDTGAYALVRRYLNQGVLPPGDAVRTEELINYFDYAYARPVDGEAPFSVATEMAPTPWNGNTQLVQIGLQGYLPAQQARSAANLVFLVDVSGSMNAPNKLPLLKNAFRLLVKQLNADDRITMVVYAGSSGVVLETTAGDRQGDILAALNKLSAGGSTHGSAGIQLAYSMARRAYIDGGINRVILATDGDFNVGTVNHAALLDLIERNSNSGISLTTLGFGDGNYNDHLMEQLADHGDGNYAYIDNLNEARKTLVEQVSATLETIAKDVKIQLEWNPAKVSEYRLIGYENRILRREDFNNDKVDAGEIGAGHSVTALYEITLADSEQRRIEALRYQPEKIAHPHDSSEIAHLKLRYKLPRQERSRMIQHALEEEDIRREMISASNSLRFAAAVAAFAELLRGGENIQQFGFQQVLSLARTARGQDQHGYRAEFIRLVELAEALDSNS